MDDRNLTDHHDGLLIRLEQVGKIYRSGSLQVPALKSVDLRIRHGEFVAIIGQSGSGKTTLLDILGCLSRPTSGIYWFDGRSVGIMTEEELATIRNQQVGFIFQSFHLLPRKTAVMNVELPLQYARVSADERQERALKLLRLVGLEDRVTHLPNQLSGGQQQRVAIARALANRPALLLADEPTGSLDSHSGMEILHLLRDLNQKGQTVLLVTHARELAQIARRLIILRDGEVIADERIEVSPGERESQQPNAAGQEAS